MDINRKDPVLTGPNAIYPLEEAILMIVNYDGESKYNISSSAGEIRIDGKYITFVPPPEPGDVNINLICDERKVGTYIVTVVAKEP